MAMGWEGSFARGIGGAFGERWLIESIRRFRHIETIFSARLRDIGGIVRIPLSEAGIMVYALSQSVAEQYSEAHKNDTPTSMQWV